MRLRIDEDVCVVGWGPGCDSYTGGHVCTRRSGHPDRHRCACGATHRPPARPPSRPPARSSPPHLPDEPRHDWKQDARCSDADPDMFYPEEGQPSPIEFCIPCPVRGDCLLTALLTVETDGVWGGVSPNGRKALAQRLFGSTARGTRDHEGRRRRAIWVARDDEAA